MKKWKKKASKRTKEIITKRKFIYVYIEKPYEYNRIATSYNIPNVKGFYHYLTTTICNTFSISKAMMDMANKLLTYQK